jgi:hypothetical protein
MRFSIKLLQEVPIPIQPFHALSSIVSKYVCISYNNRMKLIAWLHDVEHTPCLLSLKAFTAAKTPSKHPGFGLFLMTESFYIHVVNASFFRFWNAWPSKRCPSTDRS